MISIVIEYIRNSVYCAWKKQTERFKQETNGGVWIALECLLRNMNVKLILDLHSI